MNLMTLYTLSKLRQEKEGDTVTKNLTISLSESEYQALHRLKDENNLSSLNATIKMCIAESVESDEGVKQLIKDLANGNRTEKGSGQTEQEEK